MHSPQGFIVSHASHDWGEWSEFARRRVERSPRLRKYKHIILSDAYCCDAAHLRWVSDPKIRVGEIEAWAKRIQEDSDG